MTSNFEDQCKQPDSIKTGNTFGAVMKPDQSLNWKEITVIHVFCLNGKNKRRQWSLSLKYDRHVQ